MKKLALALVCVSTLFVFSSCSKGYGCFYSASEVKEIKTDLKQETLSTTVEDGTTENIAD